MPIVSTFSFDLGGHTTMGIQLEQMVENLKPLGLAAIGANCGKSLDFMARIVEEMVSAQPGIPVWVKPNAGMPIAGSWPPEYDIGPEEMGKYALHFVQAGVQIVGGCCGSTPDHVCAIAAALHGYMEE